MKTKKFYILLTLTLLLAWGCNAPNQAIAKEIKPDTLLQVSFNVEDWQHEYLQEKLQPIRDNFKQINSIPDAQWTKIITKYSDKSIEGGEVRFYYQNNKLRKIVAYYFGEMSRWLNEYYFLDEQLSFVLERTYHYNRYFLYDSIAAKENNDTEYFDFEKSEIEETRSYFDKGKLLHQLASGDCGAPFAEEYLLEEQKRILADFQEILKLLE